MIKGKEETFVLAETTLPSPATYINALTTMKKKIEILQETHGIHHIANLARSFDFGKHISIAYYIVRPQSSNKFQSKSK